MTTSTLPEKRILVSGGLVEMGHREFDLVEIILRAKKEATKEPEKKKPLPTKKRAGIETMPEPEDPALSAPDKDDAVVPANTPLAYVSSEGRDDETETDEMEIAISSEFPVKRWFGTEILDHSKDAVDLSRAKRGLSFLLDHDSRDVVGIIDKIRIDDGEKVMRGTVRFSSNAPAQAVKRDMEDGIRRFISVGYMVSELALEKSSDSEGDTYRATRWMPVEASSVAVPADPSVGANRGERRFFPVQIRSINPAPKPNLSEASMAIEVKEAQTAAAEIIRLGKRHNIDHEAVAKMIEEGISPGEASGRILKIMEERGAGKPLAQPGAERVEEEVKLNEHEQRDYNLARGIMAMVSNRELAENGSSKTVNCLEMEISQAIEKRSKQPGHGGLFVPWKIRQVDDPDLTKKYPQLFNMHRSVTGRENVQTRAGLDTKSTAAGGALVFVEPGEFIQFLYNRMRVKELGARTITGLRDNVAYPKQTGKASGSWVAENPGSDVTDSALTLAQIPAVPHTYQSSSSYSRQLLAQSVIDVDTLVREDLAMDMALAVDAAAIFGTGASSQPTGILSTTGVQSYVMIADAGNGGAPAWDDIVNMTQLLEVANADQLGTGGWLTTPEVKGKLKRTARLANTVGFPIWVDDDTVDGYEARSSNQVPKNGTKGTSSGTLHTLIRGVFETMVVSMWGNGFELVVDPYRLKKQGMVELTTFMLTDITLKYPSAFVACKFVNPT